MRKEIEKLAGLLAEKRSDISDILYLILNGEEWSESLIEHRFASVVLPADAGGKTIEYDTLTTMFSLPNEDGYYETVRGEHEYYNDYAETKDFHRQLEKGVKATADYYAENSVS